MRRPRIALRNVPRQEPAFAKLDREKHNRADNTQENDGGEGPRAIEGRLAG